MTDRPLIAITIGDPAGVGPEVVLKTLSRRYLLETCTPVVIGDADLLDLASRRLQLPSELTRLSSIDQLSSTGQDAFVLHLPGLNLGTFQPGSLTAECGRASLDYLNCAIDLALDSKVAAIATGPINKAALHLAGAPYRGHTQLLADRCGVEQVCMMLLSPGRLPEPHWLRVTHATTHIALQEVPSNLTPEVLRSMIRLTHESMVRFGIKTPRLAVAGLNPHAGDEGVMGDDEIRWIQPTVMQSRKESIDVSGPFPADTVFLRAVHGEFDAVVALYHDQGHIAVKMHGFENAVNLTLGLPIVRTSVDHGTAFDIAWQGKANEASMVAAIELAVDLVSNPQSQSR